MPYLKRTCSVKELVRQDSEAPDVNFFVIVLMLNYFRRSVNWGSALSIPEHGSIDSPPKVTQLNSILMQKNVFGFNVTVNDIFLMHVLNC